MSSLDYFYKESVEVFYRIKNLKNDNKNIKSKKINYVIVEARLQRFASIEEAVEESFILKSIVRSEKPHFFHIFYRIPTR